MALDFTGYADGDIFSGDPFGSPFGATLSSQAIPPDRGPGAAEYGFFRTLLHETMLDVKGAGRLVGALGSEALGAVGYWDIANMAIPLEFEDLTKRDYTGAVMVGAMVAGGFMAKAARSIPTIANFAKLGGGRQTAVDAGVEFLTGLAYGTLRPLEDDQDRLKTMFGDAALFGAFGAGFGVARAATKATLGKVWGGKRAWDVHRSAIVAAEKLRDEQIVFELAGLQLRDPNTGLSVKLARNSQNVNKIEINYYDDLGTLMKKRPEGAPSGYDTFNEALAASFTEGYVERMGVSRTHGIPRPDSPLSSPRTGKATFRGKIEDAISDPAMLMRVQSETGELLLDQLDNVRLEEYVAVRELVNASEDAARIKSLLGVEEIIPLNELGLFEFANVGKRMEILSATPGDRKMLSALSDHELLQQAVLADVIDIKSIEGASLINGSLKDIMLSGYIPNAGEGVMVIAQPLKDLAFKTFLTTDRIMENYPFMRKFGTYVRERTVLLDEAKQKRFELIQRLKERHKGLAGDEVRMRQIADIIDASAVQQAPGTPGTLDAEEILRAGRAALAGSGEKAAKFDFSKLLPEMSAKELDELIKSTPQITKDILAEFPPDKTLINPVEHVVAKNLVDQNGNIRANVVKLLHDLDDKGFKAIKTRRDFKSGAALNEVEKQALKIWEAGEQKNALAAVTKHSQKHLARLADADGLITVYRGETRPKGKARSGLLPVSLSPQVAARLAVDQGGTGNKVRAFRIKPEDVVQDVAATGGAAGVGGGSKLVYAERELLVPGDALAAQEVREAGELGVRLSIEDSRLAAIEAAKATGDPEIAAMTEDLVSILADYSNALGPPSNANPKGIGRLKAPRIGYFPIFNVGKWRVGHSASKGGDDIFHGFYDTLEAAENAAAQLLKEGSPYAHVGPKAWVWTDELLTLEPAHYGRLMGKMKQAAEETLSEADFKSFDEALKAQVQPGRLAPQTYAGILRERQLGIRDFAVQDIFETMSIYMGQADRTIALHEFENKAKQELAKLPRTADMGLASLHEWGERLIDDVMGRPTRNELMVERTLNHLGFGDRVKPRALKRWSSWVRGVESVSRLGGVASGAVNLTQISFNTVTTVGPKYTAIAMAELFDPRTGSVVSNFKRVRNELVKLGVDQVEMFVPLAQEGGLLVHPQASSLMADIGRAAKRAAASTKNRQRKDATRDYINVVSTSLLFAFNGAERINRVVTARAQFLKSMAEQGKRGTVRSPRAAAYEANRAVSRTQFDYRMSNMPQLFRDPAFATAFQFKSFLVNEIDFVAHLSAPELRRFTAALMATGGVSLMMNMAPVDVLDSASSAFFDKSISEVMAIDVVGDRTNPLSKAISYGVPGLIGVNLSDYAGIGSLKEITRGLYGPSIADSKSTFEFFTEMIADVASVGVVRDETFSKFVQKVQPSFWRRLNRGLDILDTGRVNDPITGNLIYKPAQRNRTALMTGVGFPTLEYSQRRAIADVAGRVKDRYIRANQDLSRQAAQAIIDGKGFAVQNLRNQAREVGFDLTDRSIKYQLNNLQRDASAKVIRRTPSQRRAEVIESMEITGTLPEGYELPKPKTGSGGMFGSPF